MKLIYNTASIDNFVDANNIHCIHFTELGKSSVIGWIL